MSDVILLIICSLNITLCLHYQVNAVILGIFRVVFMDFTNTVAVVIINLVANILSPPPSDHKTDQHKKSIQDAFISFTSCLFCLSNALSIIILICRSCRRFNFQFKS